MSELFVCLLEHSNNTNNINNNNNNSTRLKPLDLISLLLIANIQVICIKTHYEVSTILEIIFQRF
jgi:hypothetical protein